MFSDGLLHLYRSGILKRRVFDHELLQKLLNDGKISEGIGAETLTALLAAGAIHSPLSAEDVTFLRAFRHPAAGCAFRNRPTGPAGRHTLVAGSAGPDDLRTHRARRVGREARERCIAARRLLPGLRLVL